MNANLEADIEANNMALEIQQVLYIQYLTQSGTQTVKILIDLDSKVNAI